jgi:hypothetical protein
VIASLKSIVAGEGGACDLPHAYNTTPAVYDVPKTTGGEAAIEIATTQRLDWIRPKKGTNETAIIARYGENIEKIALIRAVSDNPNSPVITQENVEWARKLAFYSTNTMLREAKMHVADNDTERYIKRLEQFLIAHSPVQKSKITSGCQWAKAKELNEMLASLEEGGKVKVQKASPLGAGRKADLYTWVYAG